MLTLLVVVAVLFVAGAGTLRFIRSLDGKQKRAIKDSMNGVFLAAEARGLFPRAPAFIKDYHRDYPELSVLEDGYEVVRDECLDLLGIRDRLTDVESLGGGYTTGGIHAIQWKAFMFKSGQFIDENCRRAPKTTALLKQIPGLYTAFFSILEPHQYITPHFGYYKGFLRYHLGVSIPGNNERNECWLRVNPRKEDNDLRLKSLIDKGELYYWKNGEGVIFDDTFLHDASNDSDGVRVIMWLDIRRKMPFYLQLFNIFCLWVVHRDSSVRDIRKHATIPA